MDFVPFLGLLYKDSYGVGVVLVTEQAVHEICSSGSLSHQAPVLLVFMHHELVLCLSIKAVFYYFFNICLIILAASAAKYCEKRSRESVGC